MNDAELRRASHRLLRAGVAPRHVRRLLRELRDHREDLRAANPAVAVAEQLGTVDALVEATLARRELLALSHRAPWLVFLLSPLLGFPLLGALVGFVIAASVGLVDSAPPTSLVEAARVQRLADLVSLGVIWAPPLLLAAIAIGVALRRRTRPWWPLLALVLVAFIGAAVDLRFDVRPEAGHSSSSYTVSYPYGFDSARAAWLLGLAVVPYLALTWMQRRRETV